MNLRSKWDLLSIMFHQIPNGGIPGNFYSIRIRPFSLTAKSMNFLAVCKMLSINSISREHAEFGSPFLIHPVYPVDKIFIFC